MTVIRWPRGSTLYIGTMGALVPVAGNGPNGSLSISGGPTLQLAQTIDGGQRAQWVGGPRQWKFALDMVPVADAAGIDAITAGYLGYGPFVMVTPDMQVSNLLTPDDAMCSTVPASWQAAGPSDLPSGSWTARGLLNPTALTTAARVNVTNCPVIAGQPVTGSMWVRGSGAKITVTLYDAGGAALVSTSSTQTVGTDLVRCSVSYPSAPIGAVSAVLFVQGASAAYGPAITWTTKPMPWGAGRGVAGVVVQGVDAELKLINDSGSWVSRSFTADEVS